MTTIVVEENTTELGVTVADTSLTVVEQVSSLNIVEQTTSGNGGATVVFRSIYDTSDTVTATMSGSERTSIITN